MKIHGKEYGFAGTVEGIEKLGRLCPGGDIDALDAFLDSATVSESIVFMRDAIVVLNNAYADYMKEWEGEEVPRLTTGQAKSLTLPALRAAMTEAMNAMRADATAEMEITSVSKKNEMTTGEA